MTDENNHDEVPAHELAAETIDAFESPAPEPAPEPPPVEAAPDTRRSGAIALARLAIGALQGAALYGLYSAADAHVFPATNSLLFVPLTLIAFFVPLILLQGLGALRGRTQVLWAMTAAAILAGLGFYDVWRLWPADPVASAKGLQDVNLPSLALFFFVSVATVLTHVLVTGADRARRFVAPYPSYFELAANLAVQIALSVVFTGIFWLVLFLGSSLFNLIKIDFLSRVIEKAWFAIPATAIALSLAVHVTDVRESMVEAIRTILLALLSWLLPLLALFAAAFLLALVFTGLGPLWSTNAAAAILLAAAGALVLFANAAFQDGTRHTPKFLHIALGVTAVVLVPLVVIAAYAIYLRVAQYGWTADRVSATAITLVALYLAVNYFIAFLAALRSKPWSGMVGTANTGAVFLIVAIILALFSPLADPTRVAVASQVSALELGKIAPDKFDFIHLRWHGERFGHDALVRLAGLKDPKIAKPAADALKGIYQAAKPPEAIVIVKQITLYPSDQKIPDSLLNQKWDLAKTSNLPPCLAYVGTRCEAFIVDLNGDGRDEYLFVWGEADDGWDATVMAQQLNGPWYPAATLPWPHCKAARLALRKGQYSVVAPKATEWRGIDAGETNFQPLPVFAATGCP